MIKKVVVFGATGTVGAYSCLHIKDCGYDVIACGGRRTDNGFFADYGIEYKSVDVRDSRAFNVLPSTGVYAVVNLAGVLPARMEGYYPQLYLDVNISGSLNIYEYCARCGAQVVVTAKSISDVAYLCGSKIPIDADAEPRFPLNNDHSVYCITKNASSDLLKHYATRNGFKYYILRFPNIYLYHPNPYYFVDGEKRWQGYRLMIHNAIRHIPISVWGNPNIVRDIVYVKDCAAIIGLCLNGNAANGTYNVGTGIGTTMEDQVKGILSVFGNGDEILQYDKSKPDSVQYIFDVSKTKAELGYEAKYGYCDYLIDFKKEMAAARFRKLWGDDLTGDQFLIQI